MVVCGAECGEEGDCFDEAKQESVPVYIIPSLVRDVSIVKDLRALYCITRLIRRERVDIVHTHTSKAGIIGRFAAALSDVRAVVHSPHGHIFGKDANIPGVTGHPLQQRLFYYLERMSSSLARRIVTLTERNKIEHIKLGLAPAAKLSVLHNAVDIDKFSKAAARRKGVREELGYGESDIVIGIIGRLTTEKGHASLLEAVCKLAGRNGNIRLLIVGGGPLLIELEETVCKLGIEKHVIFLGVREDVPELVAASDIIALSSFYEGLGIVLLEAMAAKKPVVATRVGGVPEIVIDGKTGILVEPNNPEEMADKLGRLADDESLRRKLGETGFENVRENFNVPVVLEQLENIYGEILKWKNAQ
jgi:glycosyltransferase involved in cell wall biosynthesis